MGLNEFGYSLIALAKWVIQFTLEIFGINS